MKWALVGILSLHGLIHLMGFLKTWDIVEVKALSNQTSIPLAGAPLRLFGLMWLVVCAAFLLAGALLALGSGAWLPAALVAVALSQTVIVLWWNDARAGSVPNLIILITIVWLLIANTRA